MDNPNMTLGISHILIGILMIGLSIPMLKGKIKMNHGYGFRFRKSFESDKNWYKINKYGAKRLIIWSAILTAIGITTLFLPPSAIGNNLLLIAPLILIIPALESYVFAKRQ